MRIEIRADNRELVIAEADDSFDRAHDMVYKFLGSLPEVDRELLEDRRRLEDEAERLAAALRRIVRGGDAAQLQQWAHEAVFKKRDFRGDPDE